MFRPRSQGATSTSQKEDEFRKEVSMAQPVRRRESELNPKRRKSRIESSDVAYPTALTDDSAAFIEPPCYRNGATNKFGGHLFDRVCHGHGIKHRPRLIPIDQRSTRAHESYDQRCHDEASHHPRLCCIRGAHTGFCNGLQLRQTLQGFSMVLAVREDL